MNLSDRYDRRTISLHWLSATLVVGLWLLGQTIDCFPKGEARVAARGTHIVLGVDFVIKDDVLRRMLPRP